MNTRPPVAQDRPLYLDGAQPIEARIADLLPRLTVEEKVGMCHANSTFSTAGVVRLGVPELWMDDGPMGVREEVGTDFGNIGREDDFATALPATLALAATLNTDLAAAYGAVIGQEAKQRGKHVMLGPSLNIQRTPLCGRNFEYFGEDPFLAARMGVGYIEGEQAQGVASCVKHYAGNNQESQRDSINVEMDERTLREIYLPAFRAAVQEAGVLSAMGAYNRLRGRHCCENDALLNGILKEEWGFKGVVISDWGGVHSTDLAALGGLDIEMGTRTSPPYEDAHLGQAFLEGLRSGKFPISVLDEKVRRHLYVMFSLDLIRDPNSASPEARPAGPLSTPAHQAIARQVAEESMVLLKNEGTLPLDPAAIKTIAVIGANATAKFAHSGGAANVKAPYEVTAIEGIARRLGDRVKLVCAQGYDPPAGRGRQDRGDCIPPVLGLDPSLATEAVAAAKSADVVIYVGGLSHSGGYDTEGTDRRDLRLPGGQDDLIAEVLEANPRTVVVLMGGGAVEMGSWLAKTPALLYAWYLGMEGGHALARVLFGDVSPSGKLPCTFPKQLADSPAHALDAYPGAGGTVTYSEGLLVGYRWFDAREIEPLFPFGHGLSYATFEYSALKLTEGSDAEGPLVAVEFDLTNTGKREAAEAVQVYVQDVQSSRPRPVKELKGIAKVLLKPGQRRRISVRLGHDAFAFYDPDGRRWVAEAGDFRILVGSSSRDIRLEGTFKLADTAIENQSG